MKRLIALVCLAVVATGCGTSHTAKPPGPDHESVRMHSYGCGVERWGVKVGTDPDAGSVSLSAPRWTSVARLWGVQADSTPPADSRVTPFETTYFRLTNVTLQRVKLEGDSDLHLVIAGSQGKRMVAEIPSPDCVDPSSPFYNQIADARQMAENELNPSGRWQYPDRRIDIQGIGFEDFCHGQTGVAPNCVEIHPVLVLHFRS